jgi:hypothetical protein
MRELNLPVFSFRIKEEKSKSFIYDEFRKKYVTLTPEEWVRQHIAHYLKTDLHYPPGRISVEMPVKVKNRQKRCDVVVFGDKGEPLLVVECKSYEVKLNQQVVDQVSLYNFSLQVDYLVITNGMDHYCLRLNRSHGGYAFIERIPGYDELINRG